MSTHSFFSLLPWFLALIIQITVSKQAKERAERAGPPGRETNKFEKVRKEAKTMTVQSCSPGVTN